MIEDVMIDKAAAELVEELLQNSRKDGGERWFTIIRRKMKRLAKNLEAHSSECGPAQSHSE